MMNEWLDIPIRSRTDGCQCNNEELTHAGCNGKTPWLVGLSSMSVCCVAYPVLSHYDAAVRRALLRQRDVSGSENRLEQAEQGPQHVLRAVQRNSRYRSFACLGWAG